MHRIILLLALACTIAVIALTVMAQSPPSDVRLWGALSIDGIQITNVPGSGDQVYLRAKTGEIVGPFPTYPGIPQGTEVNPPAATKSPPCQRGQWAQDDNYLYLCAVVSPLVNSTGTLWRRLKFDPW